MKKVFKTQVAKKHYFSSKYNSRERWNSYWYQIKEVTDLNPEKVLEIGVGNKTVSDYLKKNGIEVITFDFDKDLIPDVVGDVRRIPFKKNSFDIVICAEVLEHLPFSDVNKALNEIKRVTKKYALITLPHSSLINLYFGVKIIPFIPKQQISIKIDFPVTHRFKGEHYWEIGKKKYSLKKIIAVIRSSGFSLEKCYFPPDNPYHRFFLLKKI